MKKTLLFTTALVMAAGLSFAAGKKDTASETAIAKAIEEAKSLTKEQIIERAQAEAAAEKARGSVFKTYGTSSRISDAGKAFSAKYGIEVESTNVKDNEVYTKLDAEISGNIDGADVALVQNGAVLKIQMMDTGYMVNYLPAGADKFIDAEDANPLVQQYINKLFIFNTKGSKAPAITNVWQLCEPEMKGSVFFKSPETEKVNENFLIMLTSKQWADKLAAAYKNLYGKDIQLGSYKNAGYKWIAEFLANCTFGDSDTKLAEEISNDEAEGKLGLFVFSKLRSKTVKKGNLEVEAYYADSKNTKVEPFAGFMYPLYVMISKSTTMPYTSMLFVDFLISSEGFKPWGKSIGAYSSNNTVGVNEGDKNLSYWKERLVMEDPDYINSAYADVFEFISKCLSK